MGSSSDYSAKVTSHSCSETQIPRKNVLVSAEVVRGLSERLRVLEEDGEALKEAVEERRKLITAICRQLQAVQNSLQLKFPEREGKDLFEHPMVERAGLSQILSQHTSPSIITRSLRIESCTTTSKAIASNESATLFPYAAQQSPSNLVLDLALYRPSPNSNQMSSEEQPKK